jgi:hypothetical protein
LETWAGISGTSIADLMSGTNNLENPPSRTERLGSLLKAPVNADDNYGSRMKGWIIPPVTADYVFWIASDNNGELWLSSDDHPENKVRVCFVPEATEVMEWTSYEQQKSPLVPLVAGDAYYFEVSPAIFLSLFKVSCFGSLYKTHIYTQCMIFSFLCPIRHS